MIENDALYITDLHHETTETELREAFAEFINMDTSYHLVISERSNKPSCAKLFLGNAEIANKCISKSRFRKIHGVTCQICFLTDESSQKFLPNICVKNLNPSTTTEDLYNLFVTKFKITKLSVIMNEKCESKGIGFVTLTNNDEINSFISTFNNFELANKKIKVQQYHATRTTPEAVPRTVCVKNFSKSMSEDELKLIFENVGQVEKVVIARYPLGGSRGFGFVTYSSIESAKMAVESLNYLEIDGKFLQVDPEKPKSNTGLHISNLDPLVNPIELKNLFEPYGKIKDFKMIQSVIGISNGYAIIHFESISASKIALKSMDKFVLNGRSLDIKEIEGSYNRTNGSEFISDFSRLKL